MLNRWQTLYLSVHHRLSDIDDDVAHLHETNSQHEHMMHLRSTLRVDLARRAEGPIDQSLVCALTGLISDSRLRE